jgi:putative endonuclease
MSKRELGRAGEKAAAKALKRAGYKVVERNFACKGGEIDLIAKDKNTLVFVEVKTRSSDEFAPPELAVNLRKRTRIIRAARFYLQRNGLDDVNCRFDIVSVLWRPGLRKPHIEILPNAFEL